MTRNSTFLSKKKVVELYKNAAATANLHEMRTARCMAQKIKVELPPPSQQELDLVRSYVQNHLYQDICSALSSLFDLQQQPDDGPMFTSSTSLDTALRAMEALALWTPPSTFDIYQMTPEQLGIDKASRKILLERAYNALLKQKSDTVSALNRTAQHMDAIQHRLRS